MRDEKERVRGRAAGLPFCLLRDWDLRRLFSLLSGVRARRNRLRCSFWPCLCIPAPVRSLQDVPLFAAAELLPLDFLPRGPAVLALAVERDIFLLLPNASPLLGGEKGRQAADFLLCADFLRACFDVCVCPGCVSEGGCRRPALFADR